MKSLYEMMKKNQRGMSLVEILIATGLMGGVALMISQAMKTTTQVQKNASVNNVYLQAVAQIQNLVQKDNFCSTNFIIPPQTIPVGGFVGFSELVGERGNVFFESGKTLGGNQIRISRMGLQRTSKETLFVIDFEKIVPEGANGSHLGGKVIKRAFPINAEYDEFNVLKSCRSDMRNHIEDAVDEAVEQMCGQGGDKRLIYDPVKKTCVAQVQFGEDNFNCPRGESLKEVGYVQNGQMTYEFKCVKPYNFQECAEGEFIRRNEDANEGDSDEYSCAKNTCGPNEVFSGFDEFGVAQCFQCNNGSIPVYSGNTWECKNILCDQKGPSSVQQYFAGISETGDPVCKNLVEGENNCPSGGTLAVNANGAIVYNCCVPNCTDTATQCLGLTYMASNGCGFCTGTKAPDCSDAHLYCKNKTYRSQDGCGICTGTRGNEPAQWQPWVATNDYRDKPLSLCVNGQMPTQQRFTRTCNADLVCGQSICSGPSEEWRDSGTRSCGSENHKWCISPPPEACVCMNTITKAFVGVENCQGLDVSCGLEKCLGDGCRPSCPDVRAENICAGYSVTPSDGCGGSCPSVYGTSPHTPASGKCMYPVTEAGLF